jgi:DNA mismatch endonuclease, patch repair protein
METHSIPTTSPSPGSWASSPAVAKVMRGNRKRDTGPELAIRRQLHRLGLRYRVAVVPTALLGHRYGRADAVFPRERVAVYLDGCWWHGCPQHFKPARTNVSYWHPKIAGNQARDRLVDAELASAGWVAIRIWEHEDPAEAAALVATVICQRRLKK